MHWSLVTFRRPMLVTSDHPVVLWPAVKPVMRPSSGARCGLLETLEVRYPLTSYACLVMTWQEGPDPERPVSGKQHHAKNLNAFTVAQAESSDGTRNGTRLVRDISPGSGSSGPTGFANAAGTLFFTAQDPRHSFEPWVSDGTAAGTRLVRDINPADCGAHCVGARPYGYTNVAGMTFFAACDCDHGRELWKAVP